MTTYVEMTRHAAAPANSCTSRPDSPSHPSTAVARVRSTWATACAYAIVFGVAFIFLMGPAGNLLAGLGTAAEAQSARFTMLMGAALVTGVGSVALSFGLGHLVDASARRRGASQLRADIDFAIGAVLFAAVIAAIYAASAAIVLGGFTSAIAGAAALGVLVPGTIAGLTARTTGPQLARSSREFAVGSLAAAGVVAIAVYLAMGVASGAADIATIAGATVLP
jgi:hypothetical protein